MAVETLNFFLYHQHPWLYVQHDVYNPWGHLVDQTVPPNQQQKSVPLSDNAIIAHKYELTSKPRAATSVHIRVPCFALQNSKNVCFH